MTSPGVTLRGFVFVSCLIIGWIVGLSLLLKVLYGARPTGGWLVVGIMISGVIYGAFLMTRDLFSTVEKSQPGLPVSPRKPSRPLKRATPGDLPKTHQRDRRLMSRSYRVALGLDGIQQSGNRRKRGFSTRRQSGGRPVTLRFNPV